jgi:hypothetical protein
MGKVAERCSAGQMRTSAPTWFVVFNRFSALESVFRRRRRQRNFDDQASVGPNHRARSALQRPHPESHGLQAVHFSLPVCQSALHTSQTGLDFILDIDYGEGCMGLVVFATSQPHAGYPGIVRGHLRGLRQKRN